MSCDALIWTLLKPSWGEKKLPYEPQFMLKRILGSFHWEFVNHNGLYFSDTGLHSTTAHHCQTVLLLRLV